MSNPLKENWDEGEGAMDDVEDASSVGGSGEGAPPTNGTTGGLGDEGRDTTLPLGNSSVPNRYREILREQRDQFSEDGSSVDNAPRRADSPMGSALSIPDDAASIQVRNPANWRSRRHTNILYVGLQLLIPRKQRPPVHSLPLRPQLPDPLPPPLRPPLPVAHIRRQPGL